jgi:acyl dehydratase
VTPGITRSYADIPFDRLCEGEVFRATYDVSPALVAGYAALVTGSSDEPAPGGGERGIAPPWVFCTFLPMFDAMNGRMAQGSIHARQSVHVRRPVAIGSRLDVEVTVERAVVRDERQRVVIVTAFWDHGELACTATATYFWGWAAP